MSNFIFNSANIDIIQNEPNIWNTSLNATEEDKELAWNRIAQAFGLTNGIFGRYLREMKIRSTNNNLTLKCPLTKARWSETL